MRLERKFVSGAVVDDAALGPRQIRILLSDPTPDRVKDVMRPEGCILDDYLKNPIVLADHDPTQPIGTAKVEITAAGVTALIDFAPEGISEKADEYCALYKAGVLKGASPGYNPVEVEPLKSGGRIIKKWQLWEISLVSIPCNQNALAVQRSAGNAKEANWKVGASRNLPLGADDAWDPEAARKSIFEHANFDGDAPDTTFARKGFLVYDATNPDNTSSYQEPFAQVIDGRLVAMPGGIKAAIARLAETEIPDDVAAKARDVLENYEGKMTTAAPETKTKPKLEIKSLYDVGSLALLLNELGYIQWTAEYEAELDGDGSTLPKQLLDAMKLLGDALIAMTVEEVEELLRIAGGVEDKGEGKSSAAPFVKALHAAQAKAGRKFSTKNETTIRDACKAIAAGHDQTKAGHDALVQLLDGDDAEDVDDTEDKAIAQSTKSARLRRVDFLQRQAG